MCLRRAADDWRLTGGERQEPDKENGGNVESRAEKLKKLGALISDVMVVVVVGCNLRLITDKNWKSITNKRAHLLPAELPYTKRFRTSVPRLQLTTQNNNNNNINWYPTAEKLLENKSTVIQLFVLPHQYTHNRVVNFFSHFNITIIQLELYAIRISQYDSVLQYCIKSRHHANFFNPES